MKDNLTKQISFRVTDTAYNSIAEEAQSCNMTIADFSRCQLEKRPIATVDRSKEVLRLTTMISTCLNKERILPNGGNIQELEKGCVGLWQLLNQ